MFDKDKIWDATEGGLTFFQDEFSSEIGSARGNLKKFSVRANDDTPSCSLHRNRDGIWTFKDFGTSEPAMNAIDYVMHRDRCTFLEACRTIYCQYNIPLPDGTKNNDVVTFADEKERPEGYFEVKFYDKIQNKKAAKRIFPFATQELFDWYDFKEIETYSFVFRNKENGRLTLKTVASTPEFPIFGYDKDFYVKLYQPYASKEFKHTFIGSKSGKRIIYGWRNILENENFKTIQRLLTLIKSAENEIEKREYYKEIEDLKADKIFIATGGSDGINLASLGYDVIWLNSETELINEAEHYQLTQFYKEIFYVPDLDETGVKQAVALAEKFIDIKLLWLPKTLLEKKKKDFADWVRSLKTQYPIEGLQHLLKNMLTQAHNFQFWDYSEKGVVQLNALKLLHFLECKNFKLLKENFINEDGTERDGTFIQIKDNIITKFTPSEIKNEVRFWLQSKFLPTSIQEKLVKTPYFNQSLLKLLPMFDYEKQVTGENFQWYFFENQAVRVTADEIKIVKYTDKMPSKIWRDAINPHPIELEKPFFEVYTDDKGRKRVKLLSNESNYLKVLINSSRVFWEKDADEEQRDLNPFQIYSKNLTDDENYQQEIHLLNKMSCVGYLLHQHKSLPNAFMVLGVDFKVGNSVKGSYGGTGKTFLLKGIGELLNMKYIEGETLRSDNFPYNGVTPKTEFVLIDDISLYQNYRSLYTNITGNFIANQKGGKKYDLPFHNSPKIGGTTNFAPNLDDGSTDRRLFFYHNSDYYHKATYNNDYHFSRKISDDFGGREILGMNYPAREKNADLMFMLQCLQLYLSEKQMIEAPKDSIVQKSQLMRLGDHFLSFFKDYFSEKTDEFGNKETTLDTFIEKSVFNNEAKENLGKFAHSSQVIKEKLLLFCQVNGWEYLEKKHRNISGTTTMHFCIVTGGEKTQKSTTEVPTPTPDNLVDDIAF